MAEEAKKDTNQDKRKKKKFKPNIGTFIFLAIVIYITASVVRDLGREKLAIYEVGESVINEEIKSSGVILRREAVLNTEEAGYVNYQLKDGARVKKGGVIYYLDKNGNITTYLNELADKKKGISQEEKKRVFEDLKALSDSYSDDNFSEIYATKNTINYDLIAYSDTLISDNKKKIQKKFGKKSFVEVKSPAAGLVTYYSDGMEGLTMDNLDESSFTQKTMMRDLRTKDKVEAGTSICRLIISQKWKLVLPVTEDEFNLMKTLKEKDTRTVKVTFLKDNLTVRVPFTYEQKDDNYYVVIHLEDYVHRYMDERYLSVRLLLSETKGLKIPTSSLVDKEVFRIPARFLTKGSGSDSYNQVNILTINSKGEKKLRQKTVSVYLREEDTVCISGDGLKKGVILSNTDKTDRFELQDTVTIQGVFMVNRGYAVFEAVDVISRNEDYCIISPDNTNLVLYDRIILNSNTIKENDVIY